MEFDQNRRKVLQLTGSLAAGLAVTSGSASAADKEVVVVESLDDVDTSGCECWNEGSCFDTCGHHPDGLQAWERECCECDDETICSDWSQIVDGCCL